MLHTRRLWSSTTKTTAMLAAIVGLGLFTAAVAHAGRDGILNGPQNAGQPHTSQYVRPIYNVGGAVSSNTLPDLCVNAINYSNGYLAGASACGKRPSHPYNGSLRRGYTNSSQNTFGIAVQDY